MKPNNSQKPRRARANPFGKLDLRIAVSHEDILADLQYPAPVRRASRRRS
jgi:hypothetical protein